MGCVFEEVVFDGHAPELSGIVAKATELTGLPLSVRPLDSETTGDLHDLYAIVAFACHPKHEIKVYAYRQGAVREFYDRNFGKGPHPIEKCLNGLHEPAGTQTVYVEGYAGQEPTLIGTIRLALVGLGGRSRHPITEEEEQAYGRPITPSQLEERYRKARNQGILGCPISLLLAPILIPLSLVVSW